MQPIKKTRTSQRDPSSGRVSQDWAKKIEKQLNDSTLNIAAENNGKKVTLKVEYFGGTCTVLGDVNQGNTFSNEFYKFFRNNSFPGIAWKQSQGGKIIGFEINDIDAYKALIQAYAKSQGITLTQSSSSSSHASLSNRQVQQSHSKKPLSNNETINNWFNQQLNEAKHKGFSIGEENVTLSVNSNRDGSLSVTGTSDIGQKSFYTFSKEFVDFLQANENTLNGIELLKTPNGKIIGFKAEGIDQMHMLIAQYNQPATSASTANDALWSIVDITSNVLSTAGSAASNALWSVSNAIGGGFSSLSSWGSSFMPSSTPTTTTTADIAKTGENALNVIKEGNGLVKMLQPVSSGWEYEAGRLNEPGKKEYRQPSASVAKLPNRSSKYNLTLQRWVDVPPKKHGEEKPGATHTKKTATTLLPKDGNINLFSGTPISGQGEGYNVGLLFDLKFCELTPYIFKSNGFTWGKWWLYGKAAIEKDPALEKTFNEYLAKAISIEGLQKFINEDNANALLDHTEVMVRLSKEAVTGVVVKKRDSHSRAEAIVERIFLKHRLGIDLPIVQITSAKGHPPVEITEEMQKTFMQTFLKDLETQAFHADTTYCSHEELITLEHLKAFAENGIDAPELASLWQ